MSRIYKLIQQLDNLNENVDSAKSTAGYQYNPYYETEMDDDVTKIFHYIKLPDGQEVMADFDSYQEMTDEDIKLWLALGMPKRPGRGPLDTTQLKQMAQASGKSNNMSEDQSNGSFIDHINQAIRAHKKQDERLVKFHLKQAQPLVGTNKDEKALNAYRKLDRAYNQPGMAEGQGIDEVLQEKSQDANERWKAMAEIEKIRFSPKIKNWDEYTPEMYKRVVDLTKITGRAMRMRNNSTVGEFIDRMKEEMLDQQMKSGSLPDFTGRASTAKDMAKQVAVHTNGDYESRYARTWTNGLGQRSRDASDFVVYSDQQSFDDAMAWAESKGKKVHFKVGSSLRSAIQVGRYVIQPATTVRGAFGDDPQTSYAVSVRSAAALDQGVRKKADITDQQATALKDIADTKNANAMEMIKAVMDMVQGEQEIKKIIDQSKKINPADKAKLDKIIAGSANFRDVAEGAVKRAMHSDAERMSLVQFTGKYGNDAWVKEFWHNINDDDMDQQGVEESRDGINDTDTIGFSVNSEAAYRAVMTRFGDLIDHDETSGVMYAPARVWPQIEIVAFDADGEGATQEDGMDQQGVAEGSTDSDELAKYENDVKTLLANGDVKTAKKVAGLSPDSAHRNRLRNIIRRYESKQGVAEGYKDYKASYNRGRDDIDNEWDGEADRREEEYEKAQQERKAKEEKGIALSGAKVKSKLANEEVKQVDELSKDTLKSYAKKAKLDSRLHNYEYNRAKDKSGDKARTDQDYHDRKAGKRLAGWDKAEKRLNKEGVEQGVVAEGKGLAKKVKIVKGPDAGKTGWIREIKHGAVKGAAKSYYIDLDDGGQANNIPGTALRLVKDPGVAEGSTTRGGFSGSAGQAQHEIQWLQNKIETLKPLLAKKPSVARQIKDLERQIRERELANAYRKKGVAEALSPQQKQAHQANLDAAQREMDRREAEGEDMTGATIDKKTYKIIKPRQSSVAEGRSIPVMDQIKIAYMTIVMNSPIGITGKEFIDYWKDYLKETTGRDVSAEQLLKLFSEFNKRKSEIHRELISKYGEYEGMLNLMNESVTGVAEEKQKGVDGKACWKGYKRMGTKQKGGKTVDNCVKISEQTQPATHQFKKGDKVRVKNDKSGEVFTVYNLASSGDNPDTVYLQQPEKSVATRASSASALELVPDVTTGGFKKGEQVKYTGKYVKELGDVVTYRRPDMRNPNVHWVETKSGPFSVALGELGKLDGKIVPIPEQLDGKKGEVTYEEVLSKLKTKLGDYLGDVARAVKDTDLGDKSTTKSDRVDDVKTLMTDDGHEIRIRGNEDDGFRITIKNQDSKSKFSTIKEAEIAAEMYCKRRAGKPRLSQDYESER